MFSPPILVKLFTNVRQVLELHPLVDILALLTWQNQLYSKGSLVSNVFKWTPNITKYYWDSCWTTDYHKLMVYAYHNGCLPIGKNTNVIRYRSLCIAMAIPAVHLSLLTAISIYRVAIVMRSTSSAYFWQQALLNSSLTMERMDLPDYVNPW